MMMEFLREESRNQVRRRKGDGIYIYSGPLTDCLMGYIINAMTNVPTDPAKNRRRKRKETGKIFSTVLLYVFFGRKMVLHGHLGRDNTGSSCYLSSYQQLEVSEFHHHHHHHHHHGCS